MDDNKRTLQTPSKYLWCQDDADWITEWLQERGLEMKFYGCFLNYCYRTLCKAFNLHRAKSQAQVDLTNALLVVPLTHAALLYEIQWFYEYRMNDGVVTTGALKITDLEDASNTEKTQLINQAQEIVYAKAASFSRRTAEYNRLEAEGKITEEKRPVARWQKTQARDIRRRERKAYYAAHPYATKMPGDNKSRADLAREIMEQREHNSVKLSTFIVRGGKEEEQKKANVDAQEDEKMEAE